MHGKGKRKGNEEDCATVGKGWNKIWEMLGIIGKSLESNGIAIIHVIKDNTVISTEVDVMDNGN